VTSGAYKKALKKLKPGIRVWEKACPLFVPLVEEGRISGPVPKLVAQEYLNPLKRKGIDALVLGCTHYPLLKPVIRNVVGSRIHLIDSALETAREVESLLKKRNWLNPSRRKKPIDFYTTDSPDSFTRLGHRFLGSSIRPARYLPVENL